MDAFPQLLAGMLVIYAILFVGIFMLYFVLLFFMGLMFYFFTGDKKPGVELLNVLMRSMTRVYAELWMIFSSFAGLVGFGMLLKVLVGALFPDFTYSISSFGYDLGYDPKQADLQLGVVLIIVSILIFSVHWGLNYMIETKEEKKGTIITKMFAGAGLGLSSVFVFGTLFTFVMELISYAQVGSSTYGVKPGGTMAILLASGPVWGYYLYKTVKMIRSEK